MATPKSFSDYMREAQASLGMSRPTGGSIDVSQVNRFGLGSANTQQAQQGSQDPLSWLIDILTRPLSGVTNVIQSGVDAAVESQQALRQGDFGGFLGATLKGANPAGNFLSGMFSTDPEQHRTFSEVIEQSTDKIGSLNPEYVDVVDNVNPVLKGTLGLAGDILADPLMWVPGAAIVKGAGLAARGAKAGAGALSGALRGGKGVEAAERAGEAALRGAAKTPRATAAGADAAQAERSVIDMITPELREQAIRNPELMAKHSDVLAESARREVAKAAQTEQAIEVSKALNMFKPMTIQERIGPKVPTLAEAKPIPFAETGGGKVAPSGKNWLPVAANLASKSPKKVAFNNPLDGKVYNLSKVLKLALDGDSRALKVARSYYDNIYVPKFAEGKANKQWVDALGNPTRAPRGSKTKTIDTIYDSLGAYRMFKAENIEAVTKALGPNLVKALDRFSSNQGFEKAVSELRAILDQSLDVTTLKELKPPTRSLLETMGIKPESIPTGMRRPKDMPNTEPVASNLAETAAEQAAKMGESGKRSGRVDLDTALSIAQQGLRQGIMRDLIKKVVDSKYPFRSGRVGAHRTADTYGDGMARILAQANEYFQWNLWKHLFAQKSASNLNRLAAEAGIKYGPHAAAYKSEWGRTVMRLQERALDEHGIPLVMGVGDDTIPLGMSQLLDILQVADEDVILRTFWNGGTAVPATNLMDAAVVAVKGGDKAEIEKMLRQVTTRHKRSNGSVVKLPNNLVRGGRYGNKMYTGDVLVRELTDLIDNSRNTLREVVADNAAAFDKRRLSEAGLIADSILDDLEAMYNAKKGFGSLLEGINDTSSRVASLANEFGATQDATNIADTVIKSVIPKGDQAAAKSAVNTAKALDDADNLAKGQKAAAEQAQKGYEAQATALLEDMGVGFRSSDDIGEVIGSRIHNGILRKIFPVFSRTFGMDKNLAKQFLQREGSYRTLLSAYTDALNFINRSGLQIPDLANLFQNARHGLPGKPETAEVQKVFERLWGQIFDTAPGSVGSVNNAFLRNGNNLENVNRILRDNKLPDDIVFDITELDKAAKSGRLGEEMLRQANDWDLSSDPVSLLYGIYKSFVDVQVEQTIVQDFLKIANDLGAFSKEAKAGFVQIDPSEFPRFGAYLPTDRFINEDVLSNLRQIDTLWHQPMDLKGPLGKFIRDVYQPALQAWKYGMTLPNPTHHIRNGISDLTLTGLAEGFNPAMHKRAIDAAFQAMATRNSYEGVDTVRMLQGMEQLPDAGKIVASGEVGEITADALYTAMRNRGNLLSYRFLEHINEDKIFGEGSSNLARLWDSIQSSVPVENIGKVSEWRDHFVRLQHAAVFIEKNINNTKAYKNLDELLDAASDQVRKWHPDGTDLTRAEQYFRLIIPFYSWQRKAIPLIAEALLTQPARVTVIPKAQYNLAVMMGINPDSLANPFPEDQLFPSFMTEQISGPIAKIDGRYYGINPGFAANDILNEWVGANPFRSLAGMTSPFLKVPFELLAGGQVGTGARINDYSDYLDSNIPLVGALSRMTGTSVTGSLISSIAGEGLDPQYQIRRGNYQPGERQTIGALNWLLGLGIQPMSMPSQINYAEIEKRDASGVRSSEDMVREWLLR